MKEKYVFTFVLISFIYACNEGFDSSRIALKVGELEITKYEFDKNLMRSGLYQNENDDKIVLKWMNDYLDKCFIITDAYELKYDTLEELNKEIAEVSKFMMVQRYGYLWKKTVSPIVDEKKKITEDKIDKRKKLFYFDYIFCYDLEKLVNLTENDTIITSVEEYARLKNVSNQYVFLKTGYVSYQWPFISFWNYRDYLLNMREGEVTKLMNIDNIYAYLYLDHIESIDLAENDEQNLVSELQIGYEKQIDDSITIVMIRKGKPVLNMKNIEKLSEFISNGKSIEHYTENFKLISYYINNTQKSIDLKSFIESIKYLPFKPNIDTKERLIEEVYQYYYNDYLSTEAEKMGLYQTDTFLLDQKNYCNNILYREYMKKEIINKITIDTPEIENYYNKHAVEFAQPKIITTDIYIFDTKADASRNRYALSNYLKNYPSEKAIDASLLKGLQEVRTGYKINMETGEGFSQEFLNLLLNQEPEILSNTPIQHEGNYVFLCKTSEEGQCLRKLSDVYTIIENKIKQRKIEARLQERIKALKKKYKIEINRTGIKCSTS